MSKKEAILKAALDLADETHFLKVTQMQVAARASVSYGLVNYYLGKTCNMQQTIINEARRNNRSNVIKQIKLYKVV